MTHYFCYIQSAAQLTPYTKIFKVKVGENQRDQIKRTLLDCYAQDTGGFFRIWDDTTDFHLSQMATYRPTEIRGTSLGLNIVHVDIKSLYQHIIDGDVQTLENPPHVVRNLFRLYSIMSPTFFVKNNRRKAKPSVQAVSRKNLSPRDVTDETNGAIGLGIMLLLYWLGSLVGCWEAAVL